MGRPLREATTVAGTGLVSAYIEYIGIREPDNGAAIRNGNPENPYHASLVIGASCLDLIHGNDRSADASLTAVRDNMTAFVEERGRHTSLSSAAAHLGLIAVMLLDRDDPGAVHRFQLASHERAITDLRRIRPICRRTDRGQGPLAEQALVGLTTRYAGPGTLAAQALLHHDQGMKKVDNTDLLVIDLGTATSPPSGHRAQLKRYCLGFCGDEAGEEFGDKERAVYMKDIVLVSGHCDVLDPETGHSLNGLGRRLELEAKGEASPHQIATLDEATLHVLQIITEPESWRIGTKPMERAREFGYAGT